MRAILLSLFIIFSTSIYSQQLINFKSHGTNPGRLNMYLHLPNKTWDTKRPLVIVLHGCAQSAESIAKATGWNKLADEYGFYVLYPQQKFTNNAGRCFNWFNKKDISKDVGEVLSIKQMIDLARDSFLIDTTRIFVFGVSAGAAMGCALLADYPYLFNAGALLAGGPFLVATSWSNGIAAMNNPKKQGPSELGKNVMDQNPAYKGAYPRVILIHGKEDPLVNIGNAYQLISQWANVNGMDEVADDTLFNFTNHKDITRYGYKNSTGEIKIIFYEVAHLGHSIMVDPGIEKNQGGERGMFTVDKGFYSVYQIAKDFGIVN